MNEAEELDSIREELIEDSRQEAEFKIRRKAVDRRRSKPTGEGSCVESTGRKRRRETMAVVCSIHGGSKDNLKPGTIGMMETLNKKCKEDDIVDGMKSCKKFTEKVFPRLCQEDLKKFESSTDNMLRSIAVYYSKGIMGKDKYRRIYKASSYKQEPSKRAARNKVANCPSPRLVPYHRLMAYIKSIDIGQLHSVRENLCDGLDECDMINGCYRDIEDLLVKLAGFYLNHGKYDILIFDQPNTFHVALGGDGAPFGRDGSACSWLVSFLNIGHGVLSSNDNFLLCGANCAENCLPVKRFLGKLITDIKRIQRSSYSIVAKGESIDVKFVFAELPNDMKMLAFLAGELTNSATYFFTFADVNQESLTKLGTFGHNASDTWKPWKFCDRMKVVKEVEKFKKKIATKNVSAKTKRSNVATFIAKQKSRQEFVPLVSELIDRAHVEPLHLKNNACALAHRYILNHAIEMSKPNLPTSFSQLPPKTPLFKFIDALRSKMFTRLNKETAFRKQRQR